MKGCRKCSAGSACDLLRQHESVRHMAAVGKGARKIMAEMPDQLTCVFTWTVLAGAFVSVLLTATCLALAYRLCGTDDSAARPPPGGWPAVRESCLLKEEQLSRPRRSASELMALDIGAGDVHLVFAQRGGRVPWSHACSVESALRATRNGGRVNVFVVDGVGAGERGENEGPSPVSLDASLAELTDGPGRLNVVHVGLDECLEHTPFRGAAAQMSAELAALAVQLAVLWQFGGTALDAGAVAVRDDVYRASGTAVEYGERAVSSPVACHAFVYDMMSFGARYLLSRDRRSGRRRRSPGGQRTAVTLGTLADSTAAWTGRAADARRVADGLECGCGGGDDDDGCYYEWCPVDRAASAGRALDSCPVVANKTVASAAAADKPVSENPSALSQ